MVIRLSAGQCRAVQGGAKRLKKDLKSAGRKAVGVQVPLRAPIKSITYRFGDRSRIRTLCSNYARTRKVWVGTSAKPPSLRCISVTPGLQTVGRVRSMLQPLCLADRAIGVPAFAPLYPSILCGAAAHSPDKSPAHSGIDISRFDRKTDRPHHPPTCSRQISSVWLRLSLTEEELIMVTAPIHPRRLLRTKQAAEYLSMSE